MATEVKLKIKLVPVIDDDGRYTDQLRETAGQMIKLADTLDKLAGRARTTSIGPSICPWILSRHPHDAHRFQIDMDVSKVGAPVDSYECPGL